MYQCNYYTKIKWHVSLFIDVSFLKAKNINQLVVLNTDRLWALFCTYSCKITSKRNFWKLFGDKLAIYLCKSSKVVLLLWTPLCNFFKQTVNNFWNICFYDYPYKNQYKLISLSSDILSFSFRDHCAQKVKLWRHNTKLQPKDRSIIYML